MSEKMGEGHCRPSRLYRVVLELPQLRTQPYKTLLFRTAMVV